CTTTWALAHERTSAAVSAGSASTQCTPGCAAAGVRRRRRGAMTRHPARANARAAAVPNRPVAPRTRTVGFICSSMAVGSIVGSRGRSDNCLSAATTYSPMNTSTRTDFDWNLVRSFLAALDHGSLLGAARALGSSQPTLGRHIAELEAQLGCVLFERTGRGLVPTVHAQALAAAARSMESGAHALARTAAGKAEEEAGAVRISASQPVACFLLPPILAQMRLAHPQ